MDDEVSPNSNQIRSFWCYIKNKINLIAKMKAPDHPDVQLPLPIGVSIFRPKPPPISGETVASLQALLAEAKAGRVSGLAMVVLHADGRFDLQLKGCATEESNQMGVAGMLAALQKMILELY